MTDDRGHPSHPTTFKGDDTGRSGIEWDRYATVHRKGQSEGLLSGMTAIESGTLAEMVALVSRMSPAERDKYVIEKAGDHELSTAEIMALASRSDFPGKMGKPR